MKYTTNIGLIEETVATRVFTVAGLAAEGGTLKKISLSENISGNWVKEQFPETEIVTNIDSIINDNDIGLVILPESGKDHLTRIADILHTGKSVRIV